MWVSACHPGARCQQQREEEETQRRKPESYTAADMDLRSELLKSIWYGFTALDLEKSGKVSKSQLKVSEGSSTWKITILKLTHFLPLLLHFLPHCTLHHVGLLRGR